jgi:hypothetical protein
MLDSTTQSHVDGAEYVVQRNQDDGQVGIKGRVGGQGRAAPLTHTPRGCGRQPVRHLVQATGHHRPRQSQRPQGAQRAVLARGGGPGWVQRHRPRPGPTTVNPAPPAGLRRPRLHPRGHLGVGQGVPHVWPQGHGHGRAGLMVVTRVLHGAGAVPTRDEALARGVHARPRTVVVQGQEHGAGPGTAHHGRQLALHTQLYLAQGVAAGGGGGEGVRWFGGLGCGVWVRGARV